MNRPRELLSAALLVLSGASCLQVLELEEGIPAKGAGSGGGGDTHSTPCPRGVTDCPVPAEPGCGQAACDAAVCTFLPTPDGTPLSPDRQTDGDCGTLVCDGNGGTRTENTPDPESDDKPCTLDECKDGKTEHVPTSSMVDCYSPDDKETLGKGACKGGVQQCNNGVAVGACVGEVIPKTEDCDVEMVDEDCDAQVNESGAACVCEFGSTKSCYSGAASVAGVGSCALGLATCNPDGLGFGACDGDVLPLLEDICDGAVALEDEDCNGVVDDDCICAPNTSVTCPYSGPPGTLGVGSCKSPTQSCDPTGKAYATACGGEVLPSFDLCTTPEDDDCNGSAAPCTGEWLLSLGDSQEYQPSRVISVGADGSTVLITANSSGGYKIVMRRVLADGSIAWTKTIAPSPVTCGATGCDGVVAQGVAQDSSGNILVTGTMFGPVNFGGGTLTPTPNGASFNYNIFVAKFNSVGNHLWSKVFDTGAVANNWGQGIAVDPSGYVYVVGRLGELATNLGGGALAPTAGCTGNGAVDGFLLKLTPGGTHVYSRRSDNISPSCAHNLFVEVAVDSAGSAFVTEYSPNAAAHVLRHYNASGTQDSTYPSSGHQSVYGYTDGYTVSVRPSGEFATANISDLVRHAANGTVMWSRQCGAPVDQLTFDSVGNLWVACDHLLTRYDAAGNATFSEQLIFADPTHRTYDIAPDPLGGVVVAGYQKNQKPVTLAGVTTNPVNSMFLAKFAP